MNPPTDFLSIVSAIRHGIVGGSLPAIRRTDIGGGHTGAIRGAQRF